MSTSILAALMGELSVCVGGGVGGLGVEAVGFDLMSFFLIVLCSHRAMQGGGGDLGVSLLPKHTARGISHFQPHPSPPPSLADISVNVPTVKNPLASYCTPPSFSGLHFSYLCSSKSVTPDFLASQIPWTSVICSCILSWNSFCSCFLLLL